MELSPQDLHELQDFIANCNPSEPLKGASSPLYEPLDQGVRGSESRSVVGDLERTIRRATDPINAPTCQLFTGFQGTGKTTELYRLKEQLLRDKQTATYVIFVNFEDYIDLYSPLTITDILRVFAYVLDREASEQEALAAGRAFNPGEVGYLKKFFDFVADLDLDGTIKQIGFNAYGASLMLEIKNNRSFRQRVNAALDLRFQKFAEDANERMAESITRLRKVTHTQRIVVIADSLEKLTYIHDKDREATENAAETVFVTHASLLRLSVHVIYTFPFWLRFRAPQIGGLYHNEPRILPMVKITAPDGAAHVEGIQALGRLVGRRMPLERVFGTDPRQTLLPLVQASGGFPRDLLRMIRNILQTTDALPVTVADCNRIIDQLGQTYERALRSSDADMLVEIAKTHAIPEGDPSRVAAFSRLFGQHFVLAYMNGSELYDLHPLVRRARGIQKRLGSPST